MERKFHISLNDEQTEEFIKSMNEGKFFHIPNSSFFDFGSDIEASPEFKIQDNFPNCCSFHKKYLNKLEEWFERFPNCCTNHKRLLEKEWFHKSHYKGLPLKIVKLVEFTRQQIIIFGDGEDWYDEITNYIEYCSHSFGSPAVGLAQYINGVHSTIIGLQKSKSIDKEDRRKLETIIQFIKFKSNPPNSKNTDLNLLLSIFQKWLKAIPNLYFIKELKMKYEGILPMNLVTYDVHYNKYLKLSYSKIRTEKELIEILGEQTKRILSSINSSDLVNSEMEEISKHEINVATEQHRIK